MKKMILPIVIFAASAMIINPIKAQQCFQVGAQVTPQMSWLMNRNDVDNPDFTYLSTFRGAVGLTSQFGCTDNIGIGLDVLYSMQGQRFKLSGVERFKQVDYLKVPVTFIYTY